MVPGHWQSWGYRVLSRAIPLVAPIMLRRRLHLGKEDPKRWREKTGRPGLPRPAGLLIWMHAVGLGEVLALRGLISAMSEQRPDLSFLVTSSSRSSADVFTKAMPKRTQHQYLPLDAPQYLRRFLDHWQPDLSIWAEQDLWPNAVWATDKRSIPLALVNGRMGQEGFQRRRKAGGLYRDLLSRFAIVSAQESVTQSNLTSLGAAHVQIDGPLKAASAALPYDPAKLASLTASLPDQPVVLFASSHAEDEAQIFPTLLGAACKLIIAPRDPKRGPKIIADIQNRGHNVGAWSKGATLSTVDVLVADSLGEMGLWYRLADTALIGGTFGSVEGHSPWEAAAIGCAILHGPRVGNFAFDYKLLAEKGAATLVTADTLAAVLTQDHAASAARAQAVVATQRLALRPLASQLLELMRE